MCDIPILVQGGGGCGSSTWLKIKVQLGAIARVDIFYNMDSWALAGNFGFP